MAEPDESESFPELDALKAQLAAKHRRLLVALFSASVVSIAVGVVVLVILSQVPERTGYALPGMFLICLGVLGIGRAIVSKYTDYDTKDRQELVGVEEVSSQHARNDEDNTP